MANKTKCLEPGRKKCPTKVKNEVILIMRIRGLNWRLVISVIVITKSTDNKSE